MSTICHQREPVFVDPSPCSLRSLGDEEMYNVAGGAGLITITIITCGAGLGTRAITTVGVAVITIADP